jgi:adenine-specific DNA-methyltransferase
MNSAAIPIKYMGSKRSLAPKIARRISREHPGATVLDVFSGMCAVGTQLVSRHPLLTNDIHAFAEAVADALFVADEERPGAQDLSKFLAHYERNRRELTGILDSRLRRERQALEDTSKPRGWRKFRDFTERELSGLVPKKLIGLDSLEDYRSNSRLFPYCLVSSYFSGAYFGVSQSVEIDSIRFAIDQAPKKLRSRYLSALVHAASHCAASPGHFAQYLIPRNRENTLYIVRIRQRSVLTRFLASLAGFPTVQCFDRDKNCVFRSDATSLLASQKSKFPKRNFVIYADPPYSKAQYSRYYHVLETVVLYDYPECESKGRYRRDRFQTNFSRSAGVVDAMTEFVSAAAGLGAPLYVSYPRNGLLYSAGGDLRSILKNHYDVVRLVEHEPLNHSTLGGAPGGALVQALEDVYYAGWK